MWPISKGWIAAGWVALLLYSAYHFWYSGIRQPLSKPVTKTWSLLAIQEQAPPLIEHIRTGEPVDVQHRLQYGPVFFFILHPVLRLCGDNFPMLCRWVYGLEVVGFILAWFFCLLSLRFWLRTSSTFRPVSTPFLMMVTGVLWLNFSPAYTILSQGTPEMWELMLIAMAFYSYLRGWRFVASFTLCAAILIKILPAVLLLYFVLRDRKALAYSALSLLLLLSIAQWLYGWEMGYGYPLMVIKNMFGVTHAMTYHENVSIKGMLVKCFAGFKLLPENPYWILIDAQRLRLANALAHLIQLAGIACTIWVLKRKTSPMAARSDTVAWEWAFLCVILMLLSPQIAFEYMTLALVAFSVIWTAFFVDPVLRRQRLAVISFGAAIFLVANILPRQVINRLLPLTTINHLGGTAHLIPSEAYQFYGFPLLGILAFVVTLWSVRDRFFHTNAKSLPNG